MTDMHVQPYSEGHILTIDGYTINAQLTGEVWLLPDRRPPVQIDNPTELAEALTRAAELRTRRSEDD